MDSGLVCLSVAVAMIASFAALDLSRRSAEAGGALKRIWIAASAVTMAVGIWSMHFLGMLAWHMDMPVAYNGTLVALSLVAAVTGSGVAFAVIARPELSRPGRVAAAGFMGLAVAAMHYLGMASMEMAASIRWNAGLVCVSIAIGFLASLVALSLFVRIQDSFDGFGVAKRVGAAVLLGVGVAGLHYAGMAAATFVPTAQHVHTNRGLSTNSLVIMLSLGAAVMFAVLIFGAAVDQRRASLAGDLELVANVARALCRAGRTREHICDAVQRLTSADYVLLFEPGADGASTVTASLGTSLDAGPSHPNRADQPPEPHDTGGSDIIDATLRGHSEIASGRHDLPDGITVHYEPLRVDEHPLGTLAVAWRQPSRRLPARTLTLLGMVASEAAVALNREHLLLKLEHLARRDELTGLLNRRVLGDELERELGAALRHGRPLSLVMLDLDNFKRYNDTAGHQAGDSLLRTSAAAWGAQLRATDVIARYGGEEFIVILPDCPLDGAVLVADRLRAAVPDGATCSAGVAVIAPNDTPAQLIGRADQALYHAKATGRNRTSTAAPSEHVASLT